MEELQQAALEGDTNLLLKIHRENQLLLDRAIVGCGFDETLLHVAALRGHLNFARQLLILKPDLVKVLDSQESSSLHLASAKGHVEIVEALVSAPQGLEMCTVLNRDGFNPLHLAAMNGEVEVLRELVRVCPKAAVARATVDQGCGETILHLCVKYHQIKALDLLVETMKDQIQEFINAGDDYGNTILHLAVATKQIQTVKHLLAIDKIDVNAKNANGYTAWDVLAQSRRGVYDWDIGTSLKEAGAKKGDETQGEWLARHRDALMVVASLLATMAFQAVVSPPGGVWSNDSPKNATDPHRAGEAVVAYNYPDSYQFFIRANTVSFVASLSTILLLISGLPLKRKTFMGILTVIVGASITSMAFTYAFSIVAVTPKKDRVSLRRTMYVAVAVWCGVMVVLLLGHTIRLTAKILKGKGIDMWKSAKKWLNAAAGVTTAAINNQHVQMTRTRTRTRTRTSPDA